jgi:hypothetical protein
MSGMGILDFSSLFLAQLASTRKSVLEATLDGIEEVHRALEERLSREPQ